MTPAAPSHVLPSRPVQAPVLDVRGLSKRFGSLEVTRNNQDENSASTSDARNLSDGERSFTTLSFELAMWEFCETPFRVLDEFDVDMGDTYRRQAVEVLMELCDVQRERQFLFITPQDMHPLPAARAAAGEAAGRLQDAPHH